METCFLFCFVFFTNLCNIGVLGTRISRAGSMRHSDNSLKLLNSGASAEAQAPGKLKALSTLLWAYNLISGFSPRHHSSMTSPTLSDRNTYSHASSTRMTADSAQKDMLHKHNDAFTYGTFDCQGFECSYRRKPASAGFEDKPPLLLIHPIGIGLSSWFWDPFLAHWDGAEVYIPDLIGCGESETWDPSSKGLFVPLDYLRQLEILWRKEIQRPMVVVSQGGLAPLVVKLAMRENDDFQGSRAVRGLVLASPPTWSEMVNGFNDKKVLANYRQLSSRLGTLGYRVLLSRFFIKKFSELFLFAANADDRWLDETCARATMDVRWPIIAFNSGMFGREPLPTELKEGIDTDSQPQFTSGIRQPTLVVSGSADKRAAQRAGYSIGIVDCRLEELPGLNILPWESPEETCRCVKAFVEDIARST